MDFILPAEWEINKACWLAWPYDENLWGPDLPNVQNEFIALCKAIASINKLGHALGEKINLLVFDQPSKDEVKTRLGGLDVIFHLIPYGDIWLRDTGPVFVKNRAGEVAGIEFGFNGWGEKYLYAHDLKVASKINEALELESEKNSFILEGGGIETNGEGIILTTRQYLLNKNRNGKISEKEVETVLETVLETQKVLWLNHGLLNDHTDGHIDTLARFVAKDQIVCMRPSGKEEPNREVLEHIINDLRDMRNLEGKGFKIHTIPSPGKILSFDGELLPASYLNFYIGNKTVVVPTYGSEYDNEAVTQISKLFPKKQVVGLSSKSILEGGGAFHCITKQQPL